MRLPNDQSLGLFRGCKHTNISKQKFVPYICRQSTEINNFYICLDLCSILSPLSFFVFVFVIIPNTGSNGTSSWRHRDHSYHTDAIIELYLLLLLLSSIQFSTSSRNVVLEPNGINKHTHTHARATKPREKKKEINELKIERDRKRENGARRN